MNAVCMKMAERVRERSVVMQKDVTFALPRLPIASRLAEMSTV
ncbi:hypothetical protein [Prosthecochloris sp.]|nr:hypothetical protein [Prosthecochloris sp.]